MRCLAIDNIQYIYSFAHDAKHSKWKTKGERNYITMWQNVFIRPIVVVSSGSRHRTQADLHNAFQCGESCNLLQINEQIKKL